MSNEGIYSVGKEFGKAIKDTRQKGNPESRNAGIGYL